MVRDLMTDGRDECVEMKMSGKRVGLTTPYPNPPVFMSATMVTRYDVLLRMMATAGSTLPSSSSSLKQKRSSRINFDGLRLFSSATRILGME